MSYRCDSFTILNVRLDYLTMPSLMPAVSCTVFAPTRLHLGLIDCSDTTQRRFGGVGISLAEPEVRLHVSIGATVRSKVVGLGEGADLRQAVLRAVNALTKDDSSVLVEFQRLPPRHIGLGTGTAALMAAAAGTAHLIGLDVPIPELALLCERGGTSGIGVNAFDVGGVIFDGGHIVAGNEPFAPSSFRTPNRLPPIISRLTMPPQWQVWLFYPEGVVVAGKDELEFFRRELPIPALESLQTLAYAYHGVAPAIVEGNLYALSYALRRIHTVGFKKRELAQQSCEVRNLLSELQANETIAAGMSSLGPLIYAITEGHNQAAVGEVRSIARSAGVEVLPACPTDSGYRIEQEVP